MIARMQGRSSPAITPKIEQGLPEEGDHRDKSDNEQDAEGEPENKNDNSSNDDGNGPNRKRRRSRKGLDKKFECPTEGCGKSYSRAEHL